MSNIVSIILIVLSIGLGIAFINPTYKDVKVLRVENAEYTKLLQSSKKLIATRDTLADKRQNFKTGDSDKLERLLPDNIDNVRLVIDIDTIATQYGMRIRDFETSDGAPDSGVIGPDNSPYGIFSLSFKTTGTYDTFSAFINDLEKSVRLIDVVGVLFKVPDTAKLDKGRELYDFEVSIRTYWLKNN